MKNRLGLAESLLSDSDGSIADVAFAAGFQSLRRFNDAFKTAHNVSPSEWRKKHEH